MPKYTRKKGSSKNNILIFFLSMLNTIKMYHWQTFSYPQHKATDELYESLEDLIDKFIEVLLGKTNSRFTLSKSFTLHIQNDTNIKKLTKIINGYKSYLINIEQYLPNSMTNADLLNIRDEIVSVLNQFLYLSTLK
jgi:hypothetical protein